MARQHSLQYMAFTMILTMSILQFHPASGFLDDGTDLLAGLLDHVGGTGRRGGGLLGDAGGDGLDDLLRGAGGGGGAGGDLAGLLNGAGRGPGDVGGLAAGLFGGVGNGLGSPFPINARATGANAELATKLSSIGDVLGRFDGRLADRSSPGDTGLPDGRVLGRVKMDRELRGSFKDDIAEGIADVQRKIFGKK